MRNIKELREPTLNVLYNVCNKRKVEYYTIREDKLRKDAIIDVKELRKERKVIEKKMEKWNMESKTYNILNIDLWIIIAKIDYIMEKFCLTEDDVKEVKK